MDLKKRNTAGREELQISPAINTSHIILPSDDGVQYELLTDFDNDTVCVACILKHGNGYREEIGDKRGNER